MQAEWASLFPLVRVCSLQHCRLFFYAPFTASLIFAIASSAFSLVLTIAIIKLIKASNCLSVAKNRQQNSEEKNQAEIISQKFLKILKHPERCIEKLEEKL